MTMNHTMSVAFRVDASLDIGTGHVMRCLTLADTLSSQGSPCRFICREHEGHLIEHIRSKDYPIHVLPASISYRMGHHKSPTTKTPAHSNWLGCDWQVDATDTLTILRDDVPDWLVVDHYALDERWESALREGCQKLMVIDDLADRSHACDLLLDQNLGREACDYISLVSSHCRLLTGSQFALLRPEFAALREFSLQTHQTTRLKSLLVTMGGIDLNNATGKVLEALKTSPLPPDCQITVVMGARAPWLEQVHAVAAAMPWTTEIQVNIDNMAQVMAESDLVIGAAGGTSWERCCLGIPSLLVILAENQIHGANALEEYGAARILGTPEDIHHTLSDGISILMNSAEMRNMSTAASKITDGYGSARVLKAMESSE